MEKKCLECGNIMPQATMFCGKCGTKHEEGAQINNSSTPKEIVCKYCNSILGDGEPFCGECGKPVDGSPPPVGANNVTPIIQPGVSTGTLPQSNNLPIAKNSKQLKPPKKKMLKWLLILIIVVAAIALGVGGFFGIRYFAEQSKDTNEVSDTRDDEEDEVEEEEISDTLDKAEVTDKIDIENTAEPVTNRPIKSIEEAYGIYTGTATISIEISDAFKDEYTKMLEDNDLVGFHETMTLSYIFIEDGNVKYSFTDINGKEIIGDNTDTFNIDVQQSRLNIIDANDSNSLQLNGDIYFDAMGARNIEGAMVNISTDPDDETKSLKYTINFKAQAPKLESNDDSSDGINNDSSDEINNELFGQWIRNRETILLIFKDTDKLQFTNGGITSDYTYIIEPDKLVLVDVYSDNIIELPYKLTEDGLLELKLIFTGYDEAKWFILHKPNSDYNENDEILIEETITPIIPVETNTPVTITTLAEKIIGTWELTADPYSWTPSIWIFANDGLIYDEDGTPILDWEVIDENTVLITYVDGFKDYNTVGFLGRNMTLMDASEMTYLFVPKGEMEIDSDMTDSLINNWFYDEVYVSEEYSNLQASIPLGNLAFNTGYKEISLPLGIIRFDGGPYIYAYCYYGYYDGVLYINFDPNLDNMFWEEYVLVG